MTTRSARLPKQIRVGIRGVGLLGSRFTQAIARTPDMKLTAAVVVPDRTLSSLLDRAQLLPQFRAVLPPHLYVAVPSHLGREGNVVRELNSKQTVIEFQGASQLSWRSECDVIVDTAWPAGKDAVEAHWRTFPGPILFQDGAAPEGRLMVPPCAVPACEGPMRVRMGDCIISGLAPLIAPFASLVSRVRVNMVTQYDGREQDYLIPERTQAAYVREDLRVKVRNDLRTLFHSKTVEVEPVIQIPSLLHYLANIRLTFADAIDAEEARRLLSGSPRVRLLPETVRDTYEVNLARAFADNLPPILVFTHTLSTCLDETGFGLRFTAALYYRTAAVLPNLDAIRILAQGMDPLEAMRQTDRDMGFA